MRWWRSDSAKDVHSTGGESATFVELRVPTSCGMGAALARSSAVRNANPEETLDAVDMATPTRAL
eukprot:CAMPEP_0117572780 /NCGR_PEP_ID=MMETSP0784-20121206/60546_1 /TAXON_ID=39447 /ORGANISM="" /LENGTH=64 /DNA_ID=CAMNT_0005371187 /DNA_START=401 /DNA_END=592 /DNA_ORIENTATION=-